MYLSMYDRSKNHISNVTNVVYDYTIRVFDKDSYQFKGISDIDVKDSVVFVLCNDDGSSVISGFVRDLSQVGSYVQFFGIDFRAIFDTDIMLDYTDRTIGYWKDYDTFYLSVLFGQVKDAAFAVAGSIFTLSATIPSDTTDTAWIANYDGSYLIVNALSFLKLYLAYFGYFIKKSFSQSTKQIDFIFTHNTTAVSIRLKDFIFERNLTETKTNHTAATVRYDTFVSEVNVWGPSTADYYNAQPSSNRTQTFGVPGLISTDGLNVGYAWKSSSGDGTTSTYYQIRPDSIERPSDLPYKHYYLGTDNLIYEDSISSSLEVIPAITRIFEDEYLNKAQYEAIKELAYSRYNETIILTHDNIYNPIDISALELYTMVTVFDENGASKTLPVSEIHCVNGKTTVKLGMKKTLLTEIIKSK